MHPAVQALRQAIYYLDRELAPSQKVRAFLRAIDVIGGLPAGELEARVAAGTLTELEGIGKSTGSVIAAAVTGERNTYLDDLAARSAIPIAEGAELRQAIRGDCHAHSTWSDGGATIREMAEAARALGHEYLCMTDHSPRLTIAHGLSEERLARQLDEIEALNEELAPFRILTGLEVDILVDGSLDLSEAMLSRLDVVVASVHSKFRMPSDEMTRRMVMAIASPHVDVLGHMTNRKVVGGGRAPSEFDADIVFAACARFGTAVEINCRPERQDPPDDLLALAVEWDCMIAINTDAHAPGQLEWQAYGCDKAARHGIAADRVINTMAADDLIAWADSHAAA
ncbi:MAG: PHP domain-containing protein [Actinomycetota bacterium]